MCRQLSTYLLFLLHCTFLFAQDNADPDYEQLLTWYDSEIGRENSGLYQGNIYLMTSVSRYTHQFYMSRAWQNGVVHYLGETFFNVPMVFDIEKGQLIIRHHDLARRDGIALDMEGVLAFSLANHHFEKIDGEFYETLMVGEQIKLISKRRKAQKTEASGITYENRSDYLIVLTNRLLMLKRKKNLETLTPRYKEYLKSIKKAHQVKFNLRKEDDLIVLMKQLDLLIKAE